MKCTLCSSEVKEPTFEEKKRTSFSCQECAAQYLYYFKDKKLQLGSVQKRLPGWNMCYNFGKNATRYVKMQRRDKDLESRKIREEYNFDGLIKPEKFLNMKAFL